jgi:hypothetical protein
MEAKTGLMHKVHSEFMFFVVELITEVTLPLVSTMDLSTHVDAITIAG